MSTCRIQKLIFKNFEIETKPNLKPNLNQTEFKFETEFEVEAKNKKTCKKIGASWLGALLNACPLNHFQDIFETQVGLYLPLRV